MSCTQLGALTIEVPKGPRGQSSVDVELEVDSDAVLIVTVSEPKTGRKLRATLATRQTPPAKRRQVEGKGIEELGGPKGKKPGILGRLLGRS